MLLVDTHVLLWALEGDERLGVEARRRLTESGRVFYSSMSVMEIRIKELLGKLDAAPDLDARIRKQRFSPLPFTHEHADALTRYPDLARHDPFDRALLAQATIDRLDLMTADGMLLGLGLAFVVDART